MGETPHHRSHTLGIWASAFALLGASASFYSVLHHQEVHREGQSSAFCNINATLNCDAVALSPYSEVWHVPLGIWGVTYFLIALWFALRLLGRYPTRALAGYGLTAFVGLCCSFLLAGISTAILHTFCLICLAVYALTALQMILMWKLRQKYTHPLSLQPWTSLLPALFLLIGIPSAYYTFWGSAKFQAPEPSASISPSDPTPSTLSKEAQEIPAPQSAFSGSGEDYRKGAEHPTVIVNEFADFQCPACRTMSAMLQQLMETFPEQVQVVFHNYPLDPACNAHMKHPLHAFACELSKLARCAGKKGHFWDFHELAFAQQSQLKAGQPQKWAQEVGLSSTEIAACLKDENILGKIQDDIQLGDRLGIKGTPSIWINGREYRGSTSTQLRQAVEETLSHNQAPIPSTP